MRHLVLGVVLTLVAFFSHAEDSNTQPTWREGVHYTRLPPEVSQSAADGSIEVVEIFRYSCPACNIFEPHLIAWEARKPTRAKLVRVPAAWSDSTRREARLFLALRELHREDLHQAVFDTIRKQRKQLGASTDDEALALQSQFAAEHGIAVDEYKAAFHSSAVDEALARAEDYIKRHKVTSTPTIIVKRQYLTSLTQAGGIEKLATLLDYLVALDEAP